MPAGADHGCAVRVPSRSRYDAFARALHWSMATLLPTQIALGFASERVASRTTADLLLDMHFQLGILLLALLAVRIAWRLLRGAPAALPTAASRWAVRFAHGVHGALYALLAILPLSGYVIWIWMGEGRTWLGLIDVPALFAVPPEDETGRAVAWYVHVYGAWLLSALVAVHVAAALWHQFIRKDGLIRQRMLGDKTH